MILSKRPEVDRFLARPTEGVRAALIYGRDRGGVRERADALALKITPRPDDPFDVALMTDGDLDEGRLEGELTALSMTGGRRLVRLRIGDGRAAAERTAGEALAAHVEGTLNPDCFFLIEAGALEKSSALRKAAEAAKTAAVCIPVYEDDTGDVARMVREALGAERLGLNPEALDLFVARLPRERGVARQEIERLTLYLGPGSGHTATAEDLTDFLGVEPDASLSEAAGDAFGGRAAPAQASLRRARAEGEGGPAAVRALGMYLFRLRRALVLTRNGAGAQEAAKAAGVFWKQEREFLRQLRAWKLSDLDSLQPEVLDADRACKTTGYPDGLVAERLAMQIAGKARRLGL